MLSLPVSYWTAFLAGILFVPVCKYLLQVLLSSSNATIYDAKKKSSAIYNLQHGILNIPLPASSMWMNVGFWKDQEVPIDFPAACRALLREVVLTAGLFDAAKTGGAHSLSTTINLLDVGFGCGDQTIYLADGIQHPGPTERPSRLSISKYVGITKSKEQFAHARDRLTALGLLAGLAESKPVGASINIFCEDAAQPEQWTLPLQNAVKALRVPENAKPSIDTWILGLDTLFHFAPSRFSLLKYANNELGASLMAFDLVLADEVSSMSFVQRLLLRLVCRLTASPYNNFMTSTQYRQMLIEAGYAAESIELFDVSADVFGPLASFLSIQDSHLRAMGKGIGALHIAKFIFGWWAKSGLVRGYVVVAKHGRAQSAKYA